MFSLFDLTPLQLGDDMNPAVVHMLLQLSPDLLVYWAEVRTVGSPESWRDETWCFTG